MVAVYVFTILAGLFVGFALIGVIISLIKGNHVLFIISISANLIGAVFNLIARIINICIGGY